MSFDPIWLFSFSVCLCVRSWQTKAFTDIGFWEACQSLTLLLGDKHDKSRCTFMNRLLRFISSLFSHFTSPLLPTLILYLYRCKSAWLSEFVFLTYLKMKRKFQLACNSLYSLCQTLLSLLALDLSDWLVLFASIPVCLFVSLSFSLGFPVILTLSSLDIRNSLTAAFNYFSFPWSGSTGWFCSSQRSAFILTLRANLITAGQQHSSPPLFTHQCFSQIWNSWTILVVKQQCEAHDNSNMEVNHQ